MSPPYFAATSSLTLGWSHRCRYQRSLFTPQIKFNEGVYHILRYWLWGVICSYPLRSWASGQGEGLVLNVSEVCFITLYIVLEFTNQTDVFKNLIEVFLKVLLLYLIFYTSISCIFVLHNFFCAFLFRNDISIANSAIDIKLQLLCIVYGTERLIVYWQYMTLVIKPSDFAVVAYWLNNCNILNYY